MRLVIIFFCVGLLVPSVGVDAEEPVGDSSSAALRPLVAGEDVDVLTQGGAKVIGDYVLSAETYDFLRRVGDEFNRAFTRIDTDDWRAYSEKYVQRVFKEDFEHHIFLAGVYVDGPPPGSGERFAKYAFKELGDRQLAGALISLKLASARSLPLEKRHIETLNALLLKRMTMMPRHAGVSATD